MHVKARLFRGKINEPDKTKIGVHVGEGLTNDRGCMVP